MSKKTRWMLIFCVLLGFIVYLTLQFQPIQRSKPVFSIDSTEVSGFSIITDLDSVKILKEGDQWYVQSPIHYPADSEMINLFFRKVLTAKRNTRLVSENPLYFDYYCVTPKKATILEIYGQQREVLTKAYFGLSDIATWMAVRMDDSKKVYEMTDNISSIILSNPSFWHDKTILEYNDRGIKQMNIHYSNIQYSLINNGKDWTYKSSSQSFAVLTANRPLFKLLNGVNNLKYSQVVADTSGEFKDRFLNPILTVEFIPFKGKTHLLEIIQISQNSCLIRRDNNPRYYFSINIDFVNRFTKSEGNFRDYSDLTY